MQDRYSIKHIEARATQDEAGFRGFLQHHQDSLNDVAQGITRELLATAVPIAALTKNQRYALFAAVADCASYTPTCSNECGHEYTWEDMPESECGLCKSTWHSIDNT